MGRTESAAVCTKVTGTERLWLDGMEVKWYMKTGDYITITGFATMKRKWNQPDGIINCYKNSASEPYEGKPHGATWQGHVV